MAQCVVCALALCARFCFERESGRLNDRSRSDGILSEFFSKEKEYCVVGYSRPYRGRNHHGCLALEKLGTVSSVDIILTSEQFFNIN